jgi:hypothetical protein
VGGTLGSAWLTQRRGDAARREEREHVERIRWRSSSSPPIEGRSVLITSDK